MRTPLAIFVAVSALFYAAGGSFDQRFTLVNSADQAGRGGSERPVAVRTVVFHEEQARVEQPGVMARALDGLRANGGLFTRLLAPAEPATQAGPAGVQIADTSTTSAIGNPTAAHAPQYGRQGGKLAQISPNYSAAKRGGLDWTIFARNPASAARPGRLLVAQDEPFADRTPAEKAGIIEAALDERATPGASAATRKSARSGKQAKGGRSTRRFSGNLHTVGKMPGARGARSGKFASWAKGGFTSGSYGSSRRKKFGFAATPNGFSLNN